jgi:hypothetical protein
LVTNPPYSGEHKQRLLQYLHTISKPFALLLPAYTATKSYWREFLQEERRLRLSPERRSGPHDPVLYLLPPASYEYSHPEGTGSPSPDRLQPSLTRPSPLLTGKDLPPFYSAWFVGGSFSSLTRSVTLLPPSLL